MYLSYFHDANYNYEPGLRHHHGASYRVAETPARSLRFSNIFSDKWRIGFHRVQQFTFGNVFAHQCIPFLKRLSSLGSQVTWPLPADFSQDVRHTLVWWIAWHKEPKRVTHTFKLWVLNAPYVYVLGMETKAEPSGENIQSPHRTRFEPRTSRHCVRHANHHSPTH